MTRKVCWASSIVALLFLSACSGYRELAKPWRFESVEGDFETAIVLQAGDRVRITSSEGRVFEGLFVEIGENLLTIAETTGGARIASIQVNDVERLEVYQKGSGKVLRTVALVAAATVVVKAIADTESGPVFHPEEGNPAKAR